jgi:DNA adenine methylase
MPEPQARPFVKWAGGKSQLVDAILLLLPPKVTTYYEPFLGGGAVFFALAQEGRFKRAVLNDTNSDLIGVYRAIRDFADEFIDQVSKLKYDKEVFYELRARDPMSFSPVRRAARMVYLNKSGFNGLYRVNRSGSFNVPFGKYKTPPKVVDPENIQACSEVLNRYAALYTKDFADAVSDAAPGDAVYFDPPYVPLTATANFSSYTADGFSADDHYRLAACARELVKKGVHVVLSNSDTDFVRSLYKDFDLTEIQARRAINSKADKRGPIGELLIVSRP